MLLPLIGVRLHGWLDELVVLVYLTGALVLGLRGPARAFLAAMGASQLGAFAFSDYGPPARSA